MFADPNMSYSSSQSSGSDCFSASSFSFSDGSYTPASSRRQSFQTIGFGDGQYDDGSTLNLPVSTAPLDPFAGMSNMIWPLECGKTTTGFPGFNSDSFPSEPFCTTYHGLPLNGGDMAPYLVTDLNSPLSDMGSSQLSEFGSSQEDFINPTETFLDAYDSHSPSTATLGNRSSPTSDYTDSSYSPTNSSYTSYLDGMRSCSTTPSRSSPLRQPIFGPLETSTALHRVQQQGMMGVSSHEQGTALKNNLAEREYQQRVIKVERQTRKRVKRENSELPVPGLKVQGRSTKKCPWEGCNGRFQRQEHLKRHEKTHTNQEQFACEFCTKLFGRSDNLKSHIALHADPSKKRTKFDPRAILVYQQLSRKPRKNTEALAIKKDPDAPSTRSRVTGY